MKAIDQAVWAHWALSMMNYCSLLWSGITRNLATLLHGYLASLQSYMNPSICFRKETWKWLLWWLVSSSILLKSSTEITTHTALKPKQENFVMCPPRQSGFWHLFLHPHIQHSLSLFPVCLSVSDSVSVCLSHTHTHILSLSLSAIPFSSDYLYQFKEYYLNHLPALWPWTIY